MTTPTYTDPTDRKLPHPGEIIAPGCGDPAGALCAHTGAIEGGLRLLTSSATRRAALAAPATAPAQPERKPMTKGQREQVARRAEAAMNGNVNLSWRDALISETEAFHDIKETP